jgi:ribulose-phosphate 3-epimerase
MRKIGILPSLLSADFGNVTRDVRAAEEAGADGLHCDVMDGHFVPNITFGPMIIKAVHRVTQLPLYVHLMIERPELFIEDFVAAGAHEISVHAEACVHLHRTIQTIKAAGLPAGVALNPSTPLSVIENVITDIDALIIMTVNPGFGGQSFIESMVPKIAKARQMALDAGVDFNIAVDGGIDCNTAPRVAAAGANLLVAGSSVFGSKDGVGAACAAIRQSAEEVFVC